MFALLFVLVTTLVLQHAMLWPLFIAGQLFYILKRSGDAVRAKTNPLSSRREYVYKFWDILVYRCGVAFVIFWTWVSYPDALTKLASSVGLSWDLNIPVIGPVAFGLGLMSDVVLEWVFNKFPSVRIELPTGAPVTQGGPQ